MKNKLFITFTLISFLGLSQSANWIKGNAVWHYKYFNPSMPGSGYIKVWDDGDTTIQNKVCTKLKSVKHAFEPTNAQGDLAEFVSDYVPGIIYYSNDTVYRWINNEFKMMYHFSAQVGDTWNLNIGTNAPFGCGDTSTLIVNSVGTVNLGGDVYNELNVGYTDSSYEYISGKINARFGPSQQYLLPWTRACVNEGAFDVDQITFICFEDDSLYYNPTNEACEYYLGLDEAVKSTVLVFPNPSQGKIELLSDIPLKYIKVLNVIGTTLKEIRTDLTLKEIDLSELPSGTYYLDIENTNGERILKSVQLLDK